MPKALILILVPNLFCVPVSTSTHKSNNHINESTTQTLALAAGVSIGLKQIDCHKTSFIHIIMCHRMFMLHFILLVRGPTAKKYTVELTQLKQTSATF